MSKKEIFGPDVVRIRILGYALLIACCIGLSAARAESLIPSDLTPHHAAPFSHVDGHRIPCALVKLYIWKYGEAAVESYARSKGMNDDAIMTLRTRCKL